MTKFLICGTRGHETEEAYLALLEVLEDECDRMFWYELEVIHGACPDSPDMFGDRFANETGADVTRFPADWKQHGRNAGFVRNNQMVCENPDLTIAVWDGHSKGTEDTIVRSVRHGIPVRIIPVDELPEHPKER